PPSIPPTLRPAHQPPPPSLRHRQRLRVDLPAARPAGAGTRVRRARALRDPEPRLDPADDRDPQNPADSAPKGHHLMIDALKKISSPSVANAIETFNVRPRNQGNMSSEIRTLFTELGPLVGYAVTAVIRAEPQPLEGHRAS